MQEFNKVTTTSNFIKQLLNDTYLPVLKTVSPGDMILENRLYILRCSVIKCTKTGYILPYDGAELSPVAQYIIINEYTFGEKNDKLCINFQSNSEGYDSLTHEGLGRYLRALRDMYGLNLMPLYNCFSNNTLPNHHIFSDRIAKTAHNYGTKLYKIPIKFNTDYTVCIENMYETTIAPAFIRNNNLVKIGKNKAGDTTDITNEYISVHMSDVVTTHYGMRFYSPIKIRFNNIPNEKIIKKQPNKFKGYSLNPLNINTSVNSKYFHPVILNSEDEYNNNKNHLYVLEGQSIRELNDTDIFMADKIYFECSINPKELGWREKVEVTSLNGITIEGEVYAITDDTHINLSKSYYEIISIMEPTKDIEETIDENHCYKYESLENTLYMLIQLPESFEGNIVILEGDYTHIDSVKIFNNSDLSKFPDNMLDNLFIKNLRLLRLNIKTVTPFSDTLMQFLLWNVICNLDTINLDMDRLHYTLNNLYINPDEHNYANYWYYKYRQIISEYINNNDITYIDDNLGYVTTEIESFLNGRRYGN